MDSEKDKNLNRNKYTEAIEKIKAVGVRQKIIIKDFFKKLEEKRIEEIRNKLKQ